MNIQDIVALLKYINDNDRRLRMINGYIFGNRKHTINDYILLANNAPTEADQNRIIIIGAHATAQTLSDYKNLAQASSDYDQKRKILAVGIRKLSQKF